ncbi:HAD family hydrolase [Metabacillus fastidiosus]|uniref:HAD family hydrolase n=1 Tax=Metabacillus fastidiosus TaxID=1458 RepID=UPI003D2C8715
MTELKGLDYAKEQTDKFHKAFGHQAADKPTLLTKEQVQTRVNFLAEELVELLGAVAEDRTELAGMVNSLTNAITAAETKQIKAGFDVENRMVAIADALIDLDVFIQGTFSMMGIQPQPLYDIVMNANMSKLGEDGKPIIRESDGKIMKPEGWEAPEPKLKTEIERQLNEKASQTVNINSSEYIIGIDVAKD